MRQLKRRRGFQGPLGAVLSAVMAVALTLLWPPGAERLDGESPAGSVGQAASPVANASPLEAFDVKPAGSAEDLQAASERVLRSVGVEGAEERERWNLAWVLVGQGESRLPAAQRLRKALAMAGALPSERLAASGEAPERLPAPIMPGGPPRNPDGSPARLVALALDDFPFPGETPRFLEALRRCHARVTFFCVGKKVRQYPELVLRAAQEGHDLQNHTYSHVRLHGFSNERAAQELRSCSELLELVTGRRPTLMRAPGGYADPTACRAALDAGLLCVDPLITPVGDMRRTADEIAWGCLQRARPGIVLGLHDGVAATRQALPAIVEGLRRRGYELVTMRELVQAGQPR